MAACRRKDPAGVIESRPSGRRGPQIGGHMNYRHVVFALLIVTAGFFAILSPSFAQQPHWNWPEHAKNLKVLPKDTEPQNLSRVMISFTRSLGVRCQHCHVGKEGQPLSAFDFPSDDNKLKDVARGMMRMVD